VATIPDRDEHRRKFGAAVQRAARHRPGRQPRAVGREAQARPAGGRRRPTPAAHLALGLGRRPLIGLLQLNVGVEAVAAQRARRHLLFLGGLSRFWYVRAARAEAANLALAEGRKKDAAAITAGPRPSNAALASFATFSGVNPNRSNSTSAGADAPKRSIPTMRPASPTHRSQPNGAAASTATRARTCGGRTSSR
jgi:hypothetical protein